jgi:hypothetical protein
MDPSAFEVWSDKTFGENIPTIMNITQGREAEFHSTFIPPPIADKNGTSNPSLYFIVVSKPLLSCTVSQCSLSTTYVDARVTCMSKTVGKADCGVDAVRKMHNPPTPSGFSILSNRIPYNCTAAPSKCTTNTATWYERSTLATSNLHRAFNTYIDNDQSLRYIQDPLSVFATEGTASAKGPINITLAEKRLSLLYNTLWKASWVSKSAMSGNLTASLESLDERLNTASRKLLTTNSTVVFEKDPVYALNIPWIVLYFISVTIMFAASIFSLVLHYRCHAPQVLGFVSSYTRDSTYFNDYQHSSCEDGIARTKRLGSIRVKLTDVQGMETVGKIALAPAQDGLRVRKGRYYE